MTGQALYLLLAVIGLMLFLALALYAIFKKGESYGKIQTQNETFTRVEESDEQTRKVKSDIDSLTDAELVDDFNKL